MQKDYQNKQINKDKEKTKKVDDASTTFKGQLYFFPDYGVTVVASSQEEANKKLAKIINQ